MEFGVGHQPPHVTTRFYFINAEVGFKVPAHSLNVIPLFVWHGRGLALVNNGCGTTYK